VLNKLNLVEYSQKRFEEVRDDLMKFLDSIGTVPKHVIPINAKGGDNLASRSANMPWYNGPALLEALDSLETERKVHSRTLCFPVQDVYGGILLGRVESGIVSKGQPVVLLPSGKESAVAEIVKYNKNPTKASSGECIGLRLADGSCADRGMIITGKDSHLSTGNSIKANIFWISEKEFDTKDSLVMKIASQKIACKISQVFKKIDSSTLAEIKPDGFFRHTEVGDVELSCESDAVHSSFNAIPALGRFVLVIDDEIVAGGIIK
jgi:sulfate adenylyltransferase subunit 1 (EFTu-like GTPase family)